MKTPIVVTGFLAFTDIYYLCLNTDSRLLFDSAILQLISLMNGMPEGKEPSVAALVR
jgi:hypothetical protein